MKNYSQCPACLSSNFSAVLEAKDHLVSFEEFQISECRDCHLRFTNPIPDENEVGKYYQSEEYISHSGTSEGLINKLYQLVRNFTLQSKRNLVISQSGSKAGKILDIGCGTGEFLNTMRNADWDVAGLEPDEGARQRAYSKLQLKVDPPEKLFELPENQFDVITLWHVLEHVHRLNDYLKQISKILKPEGLLIVAVPNYTSYDASFYGSGWAAYDVPRHLYHFAPPSMKMLLSSSNFQLTKMKSMPFDAFYVSMLSEKYRDGNILRAFWIGLLSNLKAISDKQKCSSIIYMAKPTKTDIQF